MYSKPLFAGLFGVGMGKGRLWIGLPYFVCAGFAVVALVGMGFVRVPEGQGGEGEGEGEEEGESTG
jgi:hypothetical protein